jgi:hypothetical protein
MEPGPGESRQAQAIGYRLERLGNLAVPDDQQGDRFPLAAGKPQARL